MRRRVIGGVSAWLLTSALVAFIQWAIGAWFLVAFLLDAAGIAVFAGIMCLCILALEGKWPWE